MHRVDCIQIGFRRGSCSHEAISVKPPDGSAVRLPPLLEHMDASIPRGLARPECQRVGRTV
jgi:hypothetical protein